ncbi:MAG: hypothetical protein ACYC1D_06715, partial [Acidimicrobiales bacterium]
MAPGPAVTAPRPSGVHFGEASPAPATVSPGFGRLGSLAGMVVVLLFAGGLAWSAAKGTTPPARHPELIGGSLVLEDQRPLTVIDVATAKVTVRLPGVYAEVGADAYGQVQVVPVSAGTMLVNRKTGTFNLIGPDDYVVDTAGGGVGLGPLAGVTSATGFADGAAAYIVRQAPKSTVALVDRSTVVAAARAERSGAAHPVTERGFAALPGPVSAQPGAAVVSGGDLWTLVGTGAACRTVQLTPVASGRTGLALSARRRLGVGCARAALEHIPGSVAVASPGALTVYRSDGAAPDVVALPATRTADTFLPVTGSVGTFWFLDRTASGWSLFGMTATGHVTGPIRLVGLGPRARPVVPVESNGHLYTLDQAAPGQPALLVITPTTGAVSDLPGVTHYPAKTSAEVASFVGADVVVDGPRVVFNNPASLLAVVVFTDGTHSPVVIDKSTAVDVSATGPGAVEASPPTTVGAHTKGSGKKATTPPSVAASSTPRAAAVSQQVTCANTTQKPYSPQITGVVPSSESATVTWSYQLLDLQDCQPDTWSVRVTALDGKAQPAQPVQVVNGQEQLIFVGLRPASAYQAVVTAYINAQSTPSSPVTFDTTARGPDPPTSVHTVADGNGNWVVSWTPCASAACYVPADTWTVTGTSCGAGYVGQPPAVSVPGNQTSVIISASALGLLGDSLSFSVQGSVAATGLTGNPTSDHACTQA